MEIKELPIVKSDEQVVIYDCGRMNFLARKKDTISSDCIHSESEIIFLVEGEMELTAGNETKKVKAPIIIELSPNIHHKIHALTDIKILYHYK
ncbi:MAG: hypothetical protein KAT43_04630 [Nanoarchaeota archaeon]|nr:hypothetical protein [Nanoarchaeota archaeon]